MRQGISSSFKLRCPYIECQEQRVALGLSQQSPESKQIVRKGSFYRTSDGKVVRRFRCRLCKRTFSSATLGACFRQKKRKLNIHVVRLLASGNSQRRIARLLQIHPVTVARKMIFMDAKAKGWQGAFLESLIAPNETPVLNVDFDEMETFERSKCLPLSIPLLVEKQSRKVLGFKVCEMPAKGPLAEISRKKYGPRRDERPQAAHALFDELKSKIHPHATFTTDEKSAYPNWLKPHFTTIKHVTVKGRRGAVVGQGELKKIGFDPLFDLNHTAAMFRANVNRLYRRTWCTTKRRDRLEIHLRLYVWYHNSELTKPRSQVLAQ